MKIIFHRDEKGRINLTTYTTLTPRRYISKNVFYPSYLSLRRMEEPKFKGIYGLGKESDGIQTLEEFLKEEFNF